MNEILTGPMSERSYQTLEAGCLHGPLLEATRGGVGLAVSYKNSAFRFAARIADVNRRADVHLIEADVFTLDGKRFQELTLEADRRNGVIWARSLDFGPITHAGSKPKKACFYDSELSGIPREDGVLTQVDMDRFIGLAGRSSISKGANKSTSSSSRQWTLFNGFLPIRLPLK